MAFEIGSFFATLGLDTGGYTKGLLNAQSLNAAFGQSFTNFIANPIAGGIALLKDFAGSFVRANLSILQTAQDLRRLSQETGASTELIQALGKAMEANGGKAEFVNQGILKLANTLGVAKREGGAAADMLAALGISIERFSSTDSAIRGVLDALAGIEDPALRAGIAARLLGEQAGPALANQVRAGGGSVQALIEDIRGLGQIIDSQGVQKLNTLKDALGRVEQNLDGLKTQALVGFLEGFLGDTDLTVGKVDELGAAIRSELVPTMREFGETVRSAAENMDKLVGLANDAKLALRLGFEQDTYVDELKRRTAEGSQGARRGPDLPGLRLQLGAGR